MIYLIVGSVVFVALLIFSIGFLLGWRNGHLTGIDYALRLHEYQAPGKPISGPFTEIAEFTEDTIKENGKRLLTVKEETRAKIAEMRKSGLN